MADFYKIGLLVLSDDKKKFLVCEKGREHDTNLYIMPGGQLEEESEIECLEREIEEELSCRIDKKTLNYIATYEDVAAGHPGMTVSIKLYEGKLMGPPKPTSEIKYLHWIKKEDVANKKVSPSIRNKIIPDLVKRKVLL